MADFWRNIPEMQNCLDIDSSGNVYVAGTYYTGQGDNRINCKMKLNNSGSLTVANK